MDTDKYKRIFGIHPCIPCNPRLNGRAGVAFFLSKISERCFFEIKFVFQFAEDFFPVLILSP